MNSALFRLNLNDFVKGLVVAVLTAGLGAIAPAVSAGAITVAVLQTAGWSGLAGGIAYLTKNLVTNSQGEMAKPEPK